MVAGMGEDEFNDFIQELDIDFKHENRKILDAWCEEAHLTSPVGYFNNLETCTMDIYTSNPGLLIGHHGDLIRKYKEMMCDAFNKREYHILFHNCSGFANVPKLEEKPYVSDSKFVTLTPKYKSNESPFASEYFCEITDFLNEIHNGTILRVREHFSHYILIVQFVLDKHQLALRVPGMTIGCIEFDESLKIKNIIIDEDRKKYYNEDRLYELQKFIGKDIVLSPSQIFHGNVFGNLLDNKEDE